MTEDARNALIRHLFQWAPTLGGECYFLWRKILQLYGLGFNGHPPLGVNATRPDPDKYTAVLAVSMGTHPWG